VEFGEKGGPNMGISFSFSLIQTATVPVILISSQAPLRSKAVKIQSFYMALMNEMSVAAGKLEAANGSR